MKCMPYFSAHEHECRFAIFTRGVASSHISGGQMGQKIINFSLPFLPATSSSLTQTLEGFFELTQRPSSALHCSPHWLLPELYTYKDIVRCAALGVEVPGHRQQQLTHTLIVRLMKTHVLPTILDFEKSTEYN